MSPLRSLNYFLVAIMTAAGLTVGVASSATSSTTIPVVNRNVQMNLFVSGRTLNKVNIQSFGSWSGDDAVRWSFHGRRTVTGGQSQAVGPQKVVYGVCTDASSCFKSFSGTGFPFTYACGDWVYADISIQDST